MAHWIDRRGFMCVLAGASLAPAVLRLGEGLSVETGAATAPAPKVYLHPFNYGGVQLLDGPLRRQYLATRDYYYNLPDDDILKGFRKRAGLPAPGNDLGGWCKRDASVVFGQWLSGMARMSKATGDTAMRDKATHLLHEWGKTTEADGLFFESRHAKPEHSHYVFDKTVCGLVDLWEYADEKEALALLERLTDWGMKTLDRTRKPASPADPDAHSCGNEWYTLCENLYRAYQLTGNSKYRAFGDLWRYTTYWGMYAGSNAPSPQGLHAYSHVNTLSSAAMTYAVTGDSQYLKTILNAYDYFQQTQNYATGGYGPAEKLVAADGELGRSLEREANTFETPCGTWAVFKLGRYLLQFTGEARFGDWIEELMYNGIGSALPMASEGKTFYYSDYRLASTYTLGSARKVYYWDAYPCCSGTYIQAVADYHNIIYFKDDKSLYVNLFVPSAVTWGLDGQEIRVEQETAYPESDTITLTVHSKRPVSFNLKFRVPGWSQGATTEVNSSKLEVPAHPGTWATIQRSWSPGDRVTIQIPMRLRFVPIDRQHPHRLALMYDPVVLVQDGRWTSQPTQAPTGTDLSQWIIRTGKQLEFRVAEDQAKEELAPPLGVFMPFYELREGIPYRMYFDLKT
jgi:DUF1680 family protein